MTAPKLPSSGGSYTRDEKGELTLAQAPKSTTAANAAKAKPAAKKEA